MTKNTYLGFKTYMTFIELLTKLSKKILFLLDDIFKTRINSCNTVCVDISATYRTLFQVLSTSRSFVCCSISSYKSYVPK